MDALHPTDTQLTADFARIAESVRDVVGARAAMISRVVDEVWLEVMTVVGQPSAGIVEGLRWRRRDLDDLLSSAERLGRLHATKRRAVSYVEVPDSVPETERYIGSHLGLLIAPLHAPGAELLGVLTTEGPVDIAHPPPGTCELVELYAEQARLALTALRSQETLTGLLQMSYAAQALLHDAASAEDLPALVDIVARGAREMLGAGAGWTCAELEPGVDTVAASYPPEVAERLGPDVCTLLEPSISACLRDETTLTEEAEPLLGRLAGVAGYDRALLVAIGDGSDGRGALLALRHASDGGWTAPERDAAFALGRRLGTAAEHLRVRRRDQATVEELRRLDRYRRDLVASITHDLKTPLTAIALNTELLESDRRLAEAGSHPVAAIRRSADRLSNLVDDLLAMARVNEGVDTATEVDLVALVAEACDHAESEAKVRGVTFEVDAPPRLPFVVDANALARVLANVVTNAVKFSLPGGRVRLALARVDDGVEFRCTDEGIGIPPDRLQTLFDFTPRSPDSRAEAQPGSGIGLAICQRIVSHLGGQISVTSSPGEGSTFTVRIRDRSERRSRVARQAASAPAQRSE